MLRSLRLRENHLSGEIPTTLGKLNLRLELSLDNNNLSGTIPSELGRLTNLRGLTLSDNNLYGELPSTLANLKALGTILLARNKFEIKCNCDLLSWFSDLVNSAVISDASSLPPCEQDNEYFGLHAHILRSEKDAPCTAPVIDTESSASEPYAIKISWAFDTSKISGNVAYSVDAFDRATTTRFHACRGFVVDSERFGSGFSAFAFQIDIRTANGTLTKCIWAREAKAWASARDSFGYRFEDFTPATEYEFAVRALFLFFGSDQSNVRFVVGPRSGRRVIETKEFTPLAGPVDLRYISRGASEFSITWAGPPPRLSNAVADSASTRGEVYEVGSSGERRIKVFEEVLRSHNIRELKSDTIYRIRLQAKNLKGQYGPFSTNLTVATCPQNMETVARLGDSCVAVIGYFAMTNASARSCETLPSWALKDPRCLNPGLTVNKLAVRNGAWRESLDSTSFVRCPHPDFCDGHRALDPNDTAVGPNQYCSARRRGNYCEDCVDNLIRSGANCVSCDYNANMITQAMLGLVTGVSLIVLLITCVCQAAMSKSENRLRLKGGLKSNTEEGDKKAVSLWESLSVKMRIFAGFLQVLFVYQTLLVADSTVHDVGVRFFRFLANLQLKEFEVLFDLSCFWHLERHSVRLYTQTLLPLALVTLLLGIGRSSEHLIPVLREAVWDTFISSVLFILFLIYPMVSLTVLETFWCESFPTANGIEVFREALAADYTTSCDYSSERLAAVIFAAIMVLVYPIGVILLYLWFLRRYRSASTKIEAERTARKVHFLVYPYQPEKYWFEAYELIRKFVQVSVVGFLRYSYAATSTDFLSTNQNFQLSVATVGTNIAILALVLLMYIQPYKNSGDFLYAAISLFAVAIVTQVFGGAFDGSRSGGPRGREISLMIYLQLALLFLVAIGERLLFRMSSVKK